MNPLFRFLAATLPLAAASCATKPLIPEFTTIETDTTLVCGPIRYAVQYRFTSIANAASSPALQAIEKANIQYFFGWETPIGNALETRNASLDRLRREAMDDAAAFQGTGGALTETSAWEYLESVDSEAAVVDTLLVYTIYESSYAGGAHGMYETSVHNYSLSGGYELSLGDLFTPDQLAGLGELIRNRLYDLYEVSGDEGLAEQGFFPEYIGPTENFAVTETGITFYYNPYDIGCYALGDVRIDLSREELRQACLQ